VSRDPLGDEAFLARALHGSTQSEEERIRGRSRQPVLLFVANNPVALVDPVGLDLLYERCDCCPAIDGAVRRVNAALRTGACKRWFVDHGHDYSFLSPSRLVRCHENMPMCLLYPTWTYPGQAIGVCSSHCAEQGPVALASLLIHELAHHYCTWGFGRENCAISAQDACASQLSQVIP